MRNLIVLAKVCVGVDAGVDGIIERLSGVRDLCGLEAATQSGRGLLHWASYYDAWLLGDDLDLKKLLHTEAVAPGVVEISLAEETWRAVERAILRKHELSEKGWLVWHLWQAFNAFRQWNASARLLFGREVLGVSLDDSEVLGRYITNG